MSLYKVVRPNDYFPRGAWVEDIEGGQVMETTMEIDEGKLKPYRNIGFAVPFNAVRDAMIRIQSNGIDEVGLRG